MSNSSSTFQSFTSSSTSSTVNGQTTSHSETTYSDPSGTKVHRTTREHGQAPREEQYQVDSSGRRVEDSRSNAGRITDVMDEEQKARDAGYEEKMEDEYAKREGGA